MYNDFVIFFSGSTGFYVGSAMTIADIAMWRLLGWFKGGALDGIPKVCFSIFVALSCVDTFLLIFASNF